MIRYKDNDKQTRCNHSYRPIYHVELKKDVYLIRWRCKRCGKVLSFKTSTSWVNMVDDQAGRTVNNSLFKRRAEVAQLEDLYLSGYTL